MKNLLQLFILISMPVFMYAQSSVLITEIADPSGSGNHQYRLLEICNRGTTNVDVSGWKLLKYANGQPTSGAEKTIPTSTILTPGKCYVFTTAPSGYYNLNNCIGAVENTNVVDFNGNDVLELQDAAGNRIDIFGIIGVDGSGKDWEYEDDIVTRASGITQSNPTFDINEWTVLINGTTTDVTPCVDQPFQDPLPVNWVSFIAEASENGINLVWETSEEINNDYFLVQRSLDGVSWSTLSRVASVGTTGHLRAPNMYNYSDERAIPGKNYYRIMQVDIDGAYSYSIVQSAYMRGNTASELVLYPNPVSHTLYIGGDQEILSTEVFNVNGSVMLKSTGNTRKINIESMPMGVYYLKIITDNGAVIKKFVKS